MSALPAKTTVVETPTKRTVYAWATLYGDSVDPHLMGSYKTEDEARTYDPRRSSLGDNDIKRVAVLLMIEVPLDAMREATR